jgi:hypothetical protein
MDNAYNFIPFDPPNFGTGKSPTTYDINKYHLLPDMPSAIAAKLLAERLQADEASCELPAIRQPNKPTSSYTEKMSER